MKIREGAARIGVLVIHHFSVISEDGARVKIGDGDRRVSADILHILCSREARMMNAERRGKRPEAGGEGENHENHGGEDGDAEEIPHPVEKAPQVFRAPPEGIHRLNEVGFHPGEPAVKGR